MRPIAKVVYLAVAGLLAATTGNTAVIDFSGNACSTNADGTGTSQSCTTAPYIAQSHGDTAEVDVVYKDITNSGNSLRWWESGYNTLQGVAYAGSSDNNSWARIELLPLSGWTVHLLKLDFGAWNQAEKTTTLRILDVLTNQVLLDTPLTVGTGNVPASLDFGGGYSSSNGIAIEWQDSAYNVGIDNIEFVATTVPEPSSVALLSGGLAMWGLIARRRR